MIKKTKDGKFQMLVHLDNHTIEENTYHGQFHVELMYKSKSRDYDHNINWNEKEKFSANNNHVDYHKEVPIEHKTLIEAEVLEMAHEKLYNYQYIKAS